MIKKQINQNDSFDLEFLNSIGYNYIFSEKPQNRLIDKTNKIDETNNNKLMQRACRIVMELGEVNQKEASDLLMKTDNQIKTAILMAKLGLNLESANNRLESVGGYLDQILDDS